MCSRKLPPQLHASNEGSGLSQYRELESKQINRERPLLEVDVCPLQSQNLTDAHTRVHGKNRHDPDVWSQMPLQYRTHRSQ
jgi:hypothetical protein